MRRQLNAVMSIRHSMCVLWVCAGMAALQFGTQRACAGSDTWADISDLTQYVPLAWAVGRTFHVADVEGAFQLAAAGITTVGSSELLKRVINEKRPNYKPGDRRRPFPSGHVAKAWFAAAHVQRRFGCYELEWSCWRGSTVPYAAAVATAVGRVRADRHHVRDVIASAVIAEAWVWLTTDRFDDDMSIAPSFDNGFGIAIFKKF
ncbi:MAG: phosphatase PAP2 family protein [Boseongicola sp. SB0677_bin_26]|nr:phosphatase PAP2 family protein [Boseongicola sp. SB0665_bin_10]MYG27337.1 phosphatase PAP2 family protein [Boseongicola sp. SB0677_bin_26]